MQLLFVCTGNTCRSPMAAAYAADRCRRAGRNDIQIRSAGISAFTGCLASEPAQQVMAECGLSLESFRSTRLTAPLIDDSDLIVTMARSHRAVILNALPEVADKVVTLFPDRDVSDPYGGDPALYRRTFEEMRPALDALLDRLFENKQIQYLNKE